MGNRRSGKSFFFDNMSNYLQTMIDRLCEEIAKEGVLKTPEEILKEAYKRRDDIIAKVGTVNLLISYGIIPSNLSEDELKKVYSHLWVESK